MFPDKDLNLCVVASAGSAMEFDHQFHESSAYARQETEMINQSLSLLQKQALEDGV